MKKRDSGRGNRVGLSSLGFTTVLIVLLALLVFSILASITFGNADLSVKEVYSVVAYELLHIRKFSDFAEGAVHDVVWIIRFPRVILALCVGMGLAVCGVVMQAVVKNPLADPYVLGISSGASLGATIGVLFGFGALFGANSVGVMAFLGAMGTSFLVLFIANIGGRSNAGKLTFIACMLTIVGYSINATIVIFDRIRENLKVMGKKESIYDVVNNSITQTLTRSIYTSFTTFIMGAILFILGVPSIREFALPLMVGVVCGAYSSVCITGALWYTMKERMLKKEA